MHTNVFPLLLVFALLLPQAAFAQDLLDLHGEPESTAVVDWDRGVVQAVGRADPSELPGDPRNAENLAARRAVLQARAEVFRAVRAMPLDGDILVGELFERDPDKEFEASGVIQDSPVLSMNATESRVAVATAVSLWGGLAEALAPADISFQSAVFKSLEGSSGGFTGAVVDARGTGARPALFPRLVTSAEEPVEIYGPATLPRDVALGRGVASYVSDPAEAMGGRAGPSPLFVRAVSTSGRTGADLVLDNSDASRMRSLGAQESVLQEARVVIILDPGQIEILPAVDQGPSMEENDG